MEAVIELERFFLFNDKLLSVCLTNQSVLGFIALWVFRARLTMPSCFLVPIPTQAARLSWPYWLGSACLQHAYSEFEAAVLAFNYIVRHIAARSVYRQSFILLPVPPKQCAARHWNWRVVKRNRLLHGACRWILLSDPRPIFTTNVALTTQKSVCNGLPSCSSLFSSW